MTWIPPRVLIVVAAVVVAWGGAHLLGSHPSSISPAVWPLGTPTASPAAEGAAGSTTVPVTTPTAAASGVPLLPGALRQLNEETRNTAVGIYALLRQLEGALSSRLQQLAGQLEPRH